MKAAIEHIDPHELLAKYIAGEATADEKLQVEEWIAADTANRQYYAHFKQIWEESGNLENENVVDQDQAWERFKHRTENVIPLRPRNNRWLKIAAAIVITFGAFLFAKYLLTGKDDARFATAATKPQQQSVASVPDKLVAISANKVKNDTLPDGTTITQNKNSTISYPENFDGKTRNVSLTGEAFFNVKHDDHKPFIIKVNDVQITVLGTSFNVKSYGGNTEVVVETGKVSVRRQAQTATLIAGQKLLFTPLRCKVGAVTDRSYRGYFDVKAKLPEKAQIQLDSAGRYMTKHDAVRRP